MTYEERYTEVLKALRINLGTNRKRATELGYSWEAQEQRDNADKCIAIHDLMDILSESECAESEGINRGMGFDLSKPPVTRAQ